MNTIPKTLGLNSDMSEGPEDDAYGHSVLTFLDFLDILYKLKLINPKEHKFKYRIEALMRIIHSN